MQSAVQPAISKALEEMFERIASDLSMLADRELTVSGLEVARETERPSGPGCVHISFRFGAEDGEQLRHGTLLMPLADAITLASLLMMLPDEGVGERREWASLDESLKDAMLEIGNFISGAIDAALQALGAPVTRVRFEGCQGVKEGVRPALVYTEGAPLIVGRVQVSVGSFEPFEMIAVLPEGRYLG